MSDSKSAIIFARVSSEDQRDGFSLDAQLNLATKYCKERGLKIHKVWKEQESASKENDRFKFFEMIEYVVKENIGHVVFDKVDRAVRGLKAADKIEDLMKNHSVNFHFTRENLIINEDSPPQEKFRFSLGTVIAKYYIDNLKSEISKGLNQRTEGGYWNGLAPFGYDNERVNGKALVVINDVESKIVTDVFELYATGNYTYQMLADLVNLRIPEQNATKRLIETILVNPFYYGVMKVKGKIHQGNHEKLITKDLFDSCQKIRGIRAQQYKSTRKGTTIKPFMGLLKCQCCNHSITGETVLKANGNRYNYYRCANQKCEQYRKRINEDDLFEQLEVSFEPFSKWTEKATTAFIRLLESRSVEAAAWAAQRQSTLAQARQELNDRLEALLVLHKQGVLTEQEYQAAAEVPMRLLQEQDIELSGINLQTLAQIQTAAGVIQLFKKAHEFMQLPGKKLEKIQLAKMVLSNPTLSDKTMRYDYKKPLDELFNLTERPIWWRRKAVSVMC